MRKFQPIIFITLIVISCMYLPTSAFAADQSWPSASTFFTDSARSVESRHQVNWREQGDEYRINARMQNKRNESIKDVELCAYVPAGAGVTTATSNGGTVGFKETGNGLAGCVSRSGLAAGANYNIEVAFVFAGGADNFTSMARSKGSTKSGETFSISTYGDVIVPSGGGGDDPFCDDEDFDGICDYEDDQICEDWDFDGICDSDQGTDPGCDDFDFDGICDYEDDQICDDFDFDGVCDDGSGDGGICDDEDFDGICDDEDDQICEDWDTDGECDKEQDGQGGDCSRNQIKVGFAQLPPTMNAGHIYTLNTYIRNMGSERIQNGRLRIKLPKGIKISSTNKGAEKTNNQESYLQLGKMKRGERAELQVKVRVARFTQLRRMNLQAAAQVRNSCDDFTRQSKKVQKTIRPVASS